MTMNSIEQIKYFPQIKNDHIEQVYNNEEANYLIEDTRNNSGICCIYFCSHSLFFPENEENFDKVINQQNFFEWYKTRIGTEERSIFLRDVFKSFYVTGINKKVDSIDKLCDWLKSKTEGMKIITVGGSAGGYAALVVGINLKADKIYCFSGQIDLWNYFDFPNKPMLIMHKDDEERAKYYNLKDLINCADQKTEIIYLTPSKCQQDIQQVAELKKSNNQNTKIIRIKSRRHGIPLFKESIPLFFELSEDDLKKLESRNNSLRYFTVRYGGGWKVYIHGVIGLMKYYAGRITGKVLRKA